MTVKYPSIPEPTLKPESLRDTAISMKQAFELHSGQRGNVRYAAVTWQDMIDLGWVTEADLPS